MSPYTFLGLISGIIFLGFISDIIFRKFFIPPTLLLVILGFILTNVFHLISSDMVLVFAPYFGAISVVIMTIGVFITKFITKEVKDENIPN